METEHIRPFPSWLSESVSQFTMCKYSRCFRRKECTYAHSEEERIVWNNELTEMRKKRMPTNSTGERKKHKTSALEETVAVSSTVASISSTTTSSHQRMIESRKRHMPSDSTGKPKKRKTSVVSSRVAPTLSSTIMSPHHVQLHPIDSSTLVETSTSTVKRKKRKTSALGGKASTVVSTSSSITMLSHHVQSHSSTFVETKVFQELLEQIHGMKEKGKNNIQIFGPKGTGKTQALLWLNELLPDSRYIDLAEEKETVEFDNTVLLIDNAQLFTYDIKRASIRNKTVIAAFSPDANVTAGRKCFSKCCGDGNDIHCRWRPFLYDEVKCLVNKLGFTIASKTNFEQNNITERHLKAVFSKTNGNPRFIINYFRDQHFMYMYQTLSDQFGDMMVVDCLCSPDKICESFVAILKTGECPLWDCPYVLGAAYCTNIEGLGEWKLAHSFYGFQAVEHLGRSAFKWGMRWQQLESMTQLMLSTSDVKAIGRKSELSVKGAEKTIQQKKVGETPDIDDHVVTLLVLAHNHNVVDSILYDRRGKPKKVYFVQTSSSAYSHKKKGIECLQDPVKNDSTDMSNGESIIHHYTAFLKGKVETYYIYATTDCSRSTKRDDVYFLDLLTLCPDYSRNYYKIDEIDDSD